MRKAEDGEKNEHISIRTLENVMKKELQNQTSPQQVIELLK